MTRVLKECKYVDYCSNKPKVATSNNVLLCDVAAVSMLCDDDGCGGRKDLRSTGRRGLDEANKRSQRK